MKAFVLEFFKTRRRRVWLIVAALIGTQMLWSLWGVEYMDAHELKQGWLFYLYQFPLLNSIMMPVIAAVIASRLCDVEHKGQTLKLLETVMPTGRLFDAKFLCGAAYVLAAIVLQLAVMTITGNLYGFKGAPPLPMFGYYLLFTTAVSLTILLLQQVLSLLFVNQMISLSAGLIGTFAGLFSMFFPPQVEKFILWGYYGVLMFVRMDWNPATRISNFYWAPIDWPGFVALMAIFCAIYGIGRWLFVRKEM